LAYYLGKSSYVAPGNIVLLDLKVATDQDSVDGGVRTYKYAIMIDGFITYYYIEVTFERGFPPKFAHSFLNNLL
jgi:hypothetical protein